MCTVNVGIRHDNNLVITELFEVTVGKNACAECGDNG